METSTDPGRADAHSGDLAELRRQFAEFGEVQAKQSQTLDIVTGKFNKLERASSEHRSSLFSLEAGLQGFREEVSGKFERLDNSVTWLKGQFTSREGVLIGLSEEMNGLRDDVAVLKADVIQLKTDVSELKADVMSSSRPTSFNSRPRQRAQGRRQRAQGRRYSTQGRRQRAQGRRQRAQGRRYSTQDRRQRAQERHGGSQGIAQGDPGPAARQGSLGRADGDRRARPRLFRRPSAAGSLVVDMPSVSFVVNGSLAGVSGRFVPLCREVAARNGWTAEFHVTEKAEAGVAAARGSALDGADLVVAVGGDGTVRGCAEGVASTGVPLGIVPHGTANLLARTLGIPGHPRAALDVALDQRRPTDDRLIDLAIADREPFTAMAGMGLDAAVVAGTKLKHQFGWLAYAMSGAAHLARPPSAVHDQAGRRPAHRADGAVGRRRQLRAAAGRVQPAARRPSRRRPARRGRPRPARPPRLDPGGHPGADPQPPSGPDARAVPGAPGRDHLLRDAPSRGRRRGHLARRHAHGHGPAGHAHRPGAGRAAASRHRSSGKAVIKGAPP